MPEDVEQEFSVTILGNEAFCESAIECSRTEPEAAVPCDCVYFGEFKVWVEKLNRRKGNSGELVSQWPPTLNIHIYIYIYIYNLF